MILYFKSSPVVWRKCDGSNFLASFRSRHELHSFLLQVESGNLVTSCKKDRLLIGKAQSAGHLAAGEYSTNTWPHSTQKLTVLTTKGQLSSPFLECHVYANFKKGKWSYKFWNWSEFESAKRRFMKRSVLEWPEGFYENGQCLCFSSFWTQERRIFPKLDIRQEYPRIPLFSFVFVRERLFWKRRIFHRSW